MKQVGKALSLFMGASVLGTVTQIAKGKLTALFLGVEGVGTLNQLTNLWSFVAAIAGLGLYSGMVRHLAASWRDNNNAAFKSQLSTGTVTLLGWSMLLLVLSMVLSRQLSDFIFSDDGKRMFLVCLMLTSIPLFVTTQTYRAAMNAARATTDYVRARVSADTLSVAVMAMLVWPFGIEGAVLAYVALHALFLVFLIRAGKNVFGLSMILPNISLFSRQHLTANAGFGLSAMVNLLLALGTSILVAKWTIEAHGLTENGLLSVALKVATVYMGGLAATSGGYLFPSLSGSKTDQEMHGHLNEVLSIYYYVVPPVIVVLLAGGDILITLLFTADFAPAAALLLLLLPGDLFRIVAEAVSLSFLARSKTALTTAIFVTWAGVYLALCYFLIPAVGIFGVAIAYFASHAVNVIATMVFAHNLHRYLPDRNTVAAILRGMALVALVAIPVKLLSGTDRYLASAALLVVWFAISMVDTQFRGAFRSLLERFS